MALAFRLATVSSPYLSGTSIVQNAPSGTVIGEIHVPDGTGTYTFTILSDPDSVFGISGDFLDDTGALDYQVATTHQVTIRVDNGAGDVRDAVFTITVLP